MHENEFIPSFDSLNADQRRAAEMIANGRSVFVGGIAGTGKSYLIHYIEQSMRAQRVRYQICAPTGIAALNVNGLTIHSFFKLPPSAVTIVDYRPKGKNSALRELSLLIIDEISMVSAQLLDLLDSICRIERRCPNSPFGGLQIMMVGDFAQLGPIAHKDTSPLYAFESKVWREMGLHKPTHYVELSTPQRHPDPAFAQFMAKIRLGTIDEHVVSTLKELSLPLFSRGDGCYVTDKAVVLESLNVAKNALNAREHAANPNPAYTFHCSYTGENASSKLKACLAPDLLSLKVGSPVLHLANDPLTGLCNGSSGEVVGFDLEYDEARPMVEFHDVNTNTSVSHMIGRWTWRVEGRCDSDGVRRVIATKTQIPLVLAYSWSIHKSQSSTLDPVVVNLSDIFTSSQAYVAMSRARTQAGLQIIGLQSLEHGYLQSLFQPDHRVVAFYSALQ